MKLGIILSSNKDEHAWNALRLGITSIERGHSVSIFLINEGSELETIPDSAHFDTAKKTSDFTNAGGKILACGTCMKIREQKESAVCPISTMNDLVTLIEQSDKIITF